MIKIKDFSSKPVARICLMLYPFSPLRSAKIVLMAFFSGVWVCVKLFLNY